jgi:hypothetical protein
LDRLGLVDLVTPASLQPVSKAAILVMLHSAGKDRGLRNQLNSFSLFKTPRISLQRAKSVTYVSGMTVSSISREAQRVCSTPARCCEAEFFDREKTPSHDQQIGLRRCRIDGDWIVLPERCETPGLALSACPTN